MGWLGWEGGGGKELGAGAGWRPPGLILLVLVSARVPGAVMELSSHASFLVCPGVTRPSMAMVSEKSA